ncbi:GDSL-type esterase/lipase family protein [Coraliomargarita algicola]|uniref:GDSL-type esterase/lipase family protein n=1 Tax=Coraliomargarita algicola TaxID=3092156 RepID=A0ABZ0RG71_9BACT|nr:GDSL-type esterase/lipase family protein [Coraliomargarita sp. J2-16]WPJ94206.1 GDSL-type esterase/lipase family protein [Coraliomargarita sp. J2-16]
MTVKPLLSRALAALIVFTPLSSTLWSQDEFYLKDGDRVVFYGDSITDQRLYTTFTETFVVTRFPDRVIDFVHSGWGGDRVGGGGGGRIDTRLERDVFAYDPTVMTIMLGMNDGGYRAFEQGIFDTYVNGMSAIVDKVVAQIPDIRMTLIQPSPYDDVTREPKFAGGYNAVLLRFSEAVQEIAEVKQQNVANLNAPLVAMLERAKASNPELASKIIRDRVHPGPAGHLIMAEQLLKSWNAPAVVSVVEIDATAGKLNQADNTDISGLNVGSEQLEWTQLDHALPMPVDLSNAETALAVESSDFVEALNQQIIRVTGLQAEGYALQVDGKEIGRFSPDELNIGVNLAMLNTPMSQQAATVHKLTIERANMHNMRWRTYQVPYANASEEIQAYLPNLLESLDVADRELANIQRATAQPVAHQFKLIAISAEDLLLEGAPVSSVPASLGRNLALGKSWVTNAPNTYGWDSGLTDGSWTVGKETTFATNDASDFPKHVTVDLEEAAVVGHVVIGVPQFGSTRLVEIAISADGVDFTKVGRYTFSLRKKEKRLFDFDAQSARYVRLTYLDHYDEQVGYTPSFAFTTDLQVFAASK